MKIAVVGATGLVGRNVIDLLLKKRLVNAEDLTLYASEKSDGKVLRIQNCELKVQKLCKKAIKRFNFVFFCAGGAVSKEYAKLFIRQGAIVIDNSSAFRRKKNVPLVVPEINFDAVKNKRLIANPNCSTIGASLPLKALSKKYKIKRVIISTYQAVSGAGQKGIEDLKNCTHEKFAYRICNNLIPQIDRPLLNGYTFEEDKMEFELRKILNDSTLKISTTCVRVPIENCHSEAINVEFDKVPNLKTIKKLLQNMEGVVLCDDLKTNVYPMPLIASGSESVFVGRIRKDTSNKFAINMFISFDNILKGASLNAVQIALKCLKKM